MQLNEISTFLLSIFGAGTGGGMVIKATLDYFSGRAEREKQKNKEAAETAKSNVDAILCQLSQSKANETFERDRANEERKRADDERKRADIERDRAEDAEDKADDAAKGRRELETALFAHRRWCMEEHGVSKNDLPEWPKY